MIRRRILEFYHELPPPNQRNVEDNKLLNALQEVFGAVNSKQHLHLRSLVHERNIASTLEESQKILNNNNKK